MDEKTAHLRDIFMTVAEDSTITEQQEESRGSLSSEDEIDNRLAETIEEMEGRYGFKTSLSTDQLVTVVKRFYAGDSDSDIASRLEADASTVTRARLSLHLIRDDDQDAPFELIELRELLDSDRTIDEIAAELGVSSSTVQRYKRVVNALINRRVAGDQYRAEFERILEDRELSDQLTKEVRETGLEDATDGMETNVSF